jgi:hypothetical protein
VNSLLKWDKNTTKHNPYIIVAGDMNMALHTNAAADAAAARSAGKVPSSNMQHSRSSWSNAAMIPSCMIS